MPANGKLSPVLLVVLLAISAMHASTLPMQTLEGASESRNKCEQIAITNCPELKYNHTIIDDRHRMDIGDANELLNKLTPIFEMTTSSQCSRQMRFLICSTLFPFCSDDVSQPVMACRNVCEKVKSDCAHDAIVKQFWPGFLDCEQLPQNEKRDLCLNMPNELIIEEEPKVSTAETSTESSSGEEADNAADDDDDGDDDDDDDPSKFHQINHAQEKTFWKLLTQTQRRSQVSTLSTCPQNFTLNERGHCVHKCGTDAFYTTHQKKIVETCILVFSVLCFIFTLFSLITFWTESTRFKFPERPVLFLTLCYNLLSICYLFKIFYQKSTNVHTADEIHEFNGNGAISSIKTNAADGINQCAINSQCLAYFIITNYLIISASFWWLVFGLSWWLSTAKQWSPEALERKSGLFHVLAWLLPLASPIAALLFGAIKVNELTGMCSTVGFTEIPALVLLGMGAIFIVLSARSLRSLRTSWKNSKLSQVMSRILMFGVIFAAPAIAAIVLMLLDHDKELPPCLPGETCYSPEKRTINITIVRYACLLMGGISGIWVWSKKTCVSCRKKITTVQYSNPSPHTTIENLNGSGGGGGGGGGGGVPNKYNTYKYVNSLHKSLLNNNNNYHHHSYQHKKFISGVHRTHHHHHIDWIPPQSRI